MSVNCILFSTQYTSNLLGGRILCTIKFFSKLPKRKNNFAFLAGLMETNIGGYLRKLSLRFPSLKCGSKRVFKNMLMEILDAVEMQSDNLQTHSIVQHRQKWVHTAMLYELCLRIFIRTKAGIRPCS